MKRIAQFVLSAFALMLIASCGKETDEPAFNYFFYNEAQWNTLSQSLDLPELPDDYTVNLPVHMTGTGLFTRPVSNEQAVLGRVLFYDKSLSTDGTISCASCHQQDKGFADDVAFSRGVEDNQTARNSFALSSVVNFAAYYGTDLNGTSAVRFFWDNRAETVAAQARGSLTNPDEMGMEMHEVADAVKAAPYYKPLFVKAFGSEEITEDKILDAIQDFVNAMGSYNSKFDQEAAKLYKRANAIGTGTLHNQISGYTAEENAGKALYMTNCASCHSENMGRPVKLLASNGLDLNPDDEGARGFTGNAHEIGQFKVPTLRNIALTGPYMHDGRFNTLEEVIEHYSTGIQDHPNLNSELRVNQNSNGAAMKFNYSSEEKAQLIAFLNTLTDETVATDSRFSNPFK